jgi:hypothetical protein
VTHVLFLAFDGSIQPLTLTFHRLNWMENSGMCLMKMSLIERHKSMQDKQIHWLGFQRAPLAARNVIYHWNVIAGRRLAHTSCWHKNKRNPPRDDYFTFWHCLLILGSRWHLPRNIPTFGPANPVNSLECQRINAVNRPALGWAELKSISLLWGPHRLFDPFFQWIFYSI